MTAATARRPVRVTLEGEAYRPTPGMDNVLMVVLPSGHKVCLTEGLGITVEDVEPPRVWTDGDVVRSIHNPVCVRVRTAGGIWLWHGDDDFEGHEDAYVSRRVESGGLVVLRYQHGGDA